MPERLHSVTIQLETALITIPWATREALLNQLGAHGLGETEMAGAINKAFDAVGATRPVTLDLEEKTYLLQLLDQWALELGGYDDMPAGLFALRNALSDELADAEQRPE
jgi:hypothetical protein